MEKKETYNKEFYDVNKKDVIAAEKILPYILNILKPNSIVDFGCGSGTWLYIANKYGCKDILGLDGDYIDPSWQLIDRKYFQAADFTKKVKLEKKYDLAISLEVAEHIPEEFSDIYLTSITNSSDIILFSAAIPNQEGTNHVNEQYPSYWINKFSKYGFKIYDVLRQKFWNDNDIAFWYRQNIMFFIKETKYEEVKKMFVIDAMPTDLVHPVRLENACGNFNEQYNKLKEEYNNELNKIKDDNMKYKNKIEEQNNNIAKIEKAIKEKDENLSKCQQVIEEKTTYINKLEELNKPKVTIVVPVFNVKNYLRECLDSILNQTLTQIEVLCGDGGSNDGSLEILREYEKKDHRVKVITREKSGYGQSVNECMDMARGEYIGIVESDDKVDSKMYETLYHIAKANDLDWIRSDIYFYYSEQPENEQLKREMITYGQDIYNMVLDPKYDYRPYKTALRSWAGIYKKEFLDKNHIRHHETPGGSYQDVGFYLKTLYYARRVYFLDKAFYMWRQDNPGSSIHYDSKKLVEKSVKEWDLNKQYLLNSPDADLRMWGSYNYRRYFSYLWTIDMAMGKDKKDMINFAKKEFKEALRNNQVSKDFFSEEEWKNFNKFVN